LIIHRVQAAPGRNYLEHGLMMARPNSTLCRAAVAAALVTYERKGGCR
jgi:hypothetical protein